MSSPHIDGRVRKSAGVTWKTLQRQGCKAWANSRDRATPWVETLPLFTTTFNRGLAIESRPEFVTDPLAELLRTALVLPSQGWRDQDDADAPPHDWA